MAKQEAASGRVERRTQSAGGRRSTDAVPPAPVGGRLLEIAAVAVLALVSGTGLGWLLAHTFAGDHEDAADAMEQRSTDEVEVSDLAMRSLGVEVGPAPLPANVERWSTVLAEVEDTPQSLRPIASPVAGRVRAVRIVEGEAIPGGHVVIEIVPDSWPSPRLDLTREILRPAQEEIHRMVSSLRVRQQELSIARSEYERVLPFAKEDSDEAGGDGNAPAVPRDRLIALRNGVRRAEEQFELAEHEFFKHGFTSEDVAALAGEKHGHLPRVDASTWRRALTWNGLWTEPVQELYAQLPEGVREQMWAVAVLGELSARGLVDRELVDWLTSDAKAAEHFVRIGTLRIEGHGVASLADHAAIGAFDPVVELRAPSTEGASDEGAVWDVARVHARAGDYVEMGTLLCELRDHSALRLVAHPVGREVELMQEAMIEESSCRVRALVPADAPVLEGPRVLRLLGQHEGRPDRSMRGAGRSGALAWLTVPNRVAATARDDAGHSMRTWVLRPGMVCRLSVPDRSVAESSGPLRGIELPRTAVAYDGARRFVFVVEPEAEDDDHDDHDHDGHDHDGHDHDGHDHDGHDHDGHDHDEPVEHGTHFRAVEVAVLAEFDGRVVVALTELGESPFAADAVIARSGALGLLLAMNDDGGDGGGHHHH